MRVQRSGRLTGAGGCFLEGEDFVITYEYDSAGLSGTMVLTWHEGR